MDTADGILAIPITAPFRLFPRNAAERQRVFRELAKKWHPDKAGRTDVMQHISALHDAAGKSVAANTVSFHSTKDAKTYELKAKRLYRFELGTTVIADSYVAYLIDKKHGDLMLNGIREINSIVYPDEDLKTEHKRFVPTISRVVDGDNFDVVVISKKPGLVLLRDVLDHLGLIGPKHVAWMVSSLLNITCFYQIVGLCHNGLSLDTIFVSPNEHQLYPFGGWWYATQYGDQLKYLSPSVHALAPRSMLSSKIADHRLDLECIRAIARTCLGTDMSNVPTALADFVRLPAPNNPMDDYKRWEKVRRDSFGKRRFVELPVNASDIYG